MDNQPKTRKESKKDSRQKSGGKYSQKHIRAVEALIEKRQEKGASTNDKAKKEKPKR